ncbi:MAG: DUF6630 family protein [Thermoguttaceae bacterium]
MVTRDPAFVHIAQVILASDYPEFERMIQDRDELGFKEFCVRYSSFIQDEYVSDFETRLSLPTEDWGVSAACIETDWLFLRFACWKKRLEWQDWTGECEEGETVACLDEMLKRHWNQKLDWDADAYYSSFGSLRLERGDHAVILYKALDNRLKTMGVRFVNIDIGSDCYYFGVLPSKELEKVHRLKWEIFTIENDDVCRGYHYGGLFDTVLSWFGFKKPCAVEILERLDKESEVK